MKFMAEVHDPERQAEWLQYFGASYVPIKSPIPEWASAPGIRQARFYKVDWPQLSDEQKESICRYMAEKFGYDLDGVRAEIQEMGYVPILADGVTVTSTIPLD